MISLLLQTFARLPRVIPADFRVSGKFDNPKNRRNTVLGSINKVRSPIESQMETCVMVPRNP